MQDILFSPARWAIYIAMAVLSHVICTVWGAVRRVLVPFLQSNWQRRVFVATSRVPALLVVGFFSVLVMGAPRLFPQIPTQSYLLMCLAIPYIFAPHVLTRGRGLFHLDGTWPRKLRVHLRSVETDAGRLPPYMTELDDVVRLAKLSRATGLVMASPLLVEAQTRRLLKRRLLQLCKEAGLQVKWHEKERTLTSFESGLFSPYRAQYEELNDRIVWKDPTRVMSCKITITFN